jgi:hypothetical protein
VDGAQLLRPRVDRVTFRLFPVALVNRWVAV